MSPAEQGAADDPGHEARNTQLGQYRRAATPADPGLDGDAGSSGPARVMTFTPTVQSRAPAGGAQPADLAAQHRDGHGKQARHLRRRESHPWPAHVRVGDDRGGLFVQGALQRHRQGGIVLVVMAKIRHWATLPGRYLRISVSGSSDTEPVAPSNT